MQPEDIFTVLFRLLRGIRHIGGKLQNYLRKLEVAGEIVKIFIDAAIEVRDIQAFGNNFGFCRI